MVNGRIPSTLSRQLTSSFMSYGQPNRQYYLNYGSNMNSDQIAKPYPLCPEKQAQSG